MKRLLALGAAAVLLALAACTPNTAPLDPNVPQPPPETACQKAAKAVDVSDGLLSVAQIGYAGLVATGAVKPKPATDAQIRAAFASGAAAIASARQHIAQGQCDNFTDYTRDATAAISAYANLIAQERADKDAKKNAAPPAS